MFPQALACGVRRLAVSTSMSSIVATGRILIVVFLVAGVLIAAAGLVALKLGEPLRKFVLRIG